MTLISLRLLQRHIARIERPEGPVSGRMLFGHPGMDQALGGGLARGRLHEVFVSTWEEAGGGGGFAAALLRLLDNSALWLREEAAERRIGRLYAAGLAEVGLEPARLILGVLPDATAVLRAAADGLRCNVLGGVVIELWGNQRLLDLTASRRLALAAETSGVTPILLRVGGAPSPSVAQTRWRVTSAPSIALPAEAPGRPAWDLELLRQRSGPAGGVWHVEWDPERAILQERHDHDAAALPGAVVSPSSDRSPGADGGWRRAG